MPHYTHDNLFSRKMHHRGDFASPEVSRKYAPPLEFTPTHQTISLSFDIPNQRVEGWVETKLTAAIEHACIIRYDAIDMEIQKVEGCDSYHYDGHHLVCKWDNPKARGDTCSTRVYYAVDHPISGLYFSNPDEIYPDRPTYAVVDVESIRARYWLPCVDHLSVRCTLDFYLTSLQDHIILANGQQISEEPQGNGRKIAHWQLDFPCPSYLITLAVGEFVEFKDRDADGGKGPIPVRYYTTKDFSGEDLGASFAGTPEFIEWMTKKLQCPLEWPKYYQIATALHSGAMENISFVTWGDFAVLDARGRDEMKFLIDDVNVHEMSHSWFGDMVVCSEFTHAWLKESWATYVEKLFFEDYYGVDAYKYGMYEDRRYYMKESDTRYARPIVCSKYDSSWDMYDDHLYPGGSFRIHMLRHMLGDTAFFAAVSDYLNTFKGKTVETIDFQRKLEAHWGRDLQPFFDQWLHSPGYPQLKAKFTYDDKQGLAKVEIEQAQEDKDHGIGLFTFPLVIEWEDGEGHAHRQTFEIKEQKTACYFRTAQKPQQIRLDPDFVQLFSLEFNPGDDILARQLQNSDVIGKIFAAVELGKTGTRKNLEQIAHQYPQETFWGVKVEYLQALIGSGNEFGLDSAASLISQETDPKVLYNAVSKFRGKCTPKVAEAMKSLIHRDTYYYYSTGEALKVLGSNRAKAKETFDYLQNLKLPKDFRGILEGLHLNAIAQLRTPQAIQWVASKIPYGQVSDHSRRALFEALGEVLTWAEQEVKAPAIDGLKTELLSRAYPEIVYLYAARFLSQAGSTSDIPFLQQLKRNSATQNHPRIDKFAKKLQKGKSGADDLKKYESRITKLEEKVAKLLAKVEDIEALQQGPEEK